MTAAHWLRVKAIFEQGIATGNATFQTGVSTWQEWAESPLAAGRRVALTAGYGASGPVPGHWRDTVLLERRSPVVNAAASI